MPAPIGRHSSTESEATELGGHVLGLPGDHCLGGLGEPAGGAHPLGRGVFKKDLEGERGEGIAGDDGVADAVRGPDCRAVPPLEVPVDDVVVDEGEIVHQLDGDPADDPGTVLGSDMPPPR